MPEYDIKISELNRVVPNPPFTEDFFPLVHSQSMTTYRATLQDIGSLMTHSIYADTASYSSGNISSSHANFADSASHANTASYAISASHALVADSASFYPNQQFQASCSWASHSHDSDYATRSLDVDLTGTHYQFPYWNSTNTNGGLNTSSPLQVTSSYTTQEGIIVSGPNLSFFPSVSVPYDTPPVGVGTPNPYIVAGNSPIKSNNLFGQPFAAGGFYSTYPITSPSFVGTDQILWAVATASFSYFSNQFWSGSNAFGSLSTISVAPDSIRNTFNGKWIRIACFSQYSFTVSPNAAYGEVRNYGGTPMTGRVFLRCSTGGPTGQSITGSRQGIDMLLYGDLFGGGLMATVLHAGHYEGATSTDIIRKIRIQSSNPPDPLVTMDVFVDNIPTGAVSLTIFAQSWGALTFLTTANVDPPPIVVSGSNDIHSANYLIFPAAPGYYSTLGRYQNYIFGGNNVVINPTYNEITESSPSFGSTNPAMYSSYSLNVSGTINASDKYYVNNRVGLTTTAVYGTNVLTFVGGILVGKTPP